METRSGSEDGKREIFQRRISSTSARKRLPVPPRCLVDLPNFDGGHAVEMKVLCEKEVYGVTCTTRRTGKYSKPVLSKGWIRMARKLQLKAGDKVTIFKLQKTQQNGANYSIEIEKEAADVNKKMTISDDDDLDHDYPYNPLLDSQSWGARADHHHHHQWETQKMMRLLEPAAGGSCFGGATPMKSLKIFGVWVHGMIHDDDAADDEDEVSFMTPAAIVPPPDSGGDQPLLDSTLSLSIKKHS